MIYAGSSGGSQWESNDLTSIYNSTLQIPQNGKTDKQATEGRNPYTGVQTVERDCARCGGRFTALAKEVKRGGGIYCSRDCQRAPGSSRTATRRRARKLWIERNGGAHPICRKCCQKADIHHVDGDPLNNAPENHDRLCRSHHTSLEDAAFPRRKVAA